MSEVAKDKNLIVFILVMFRKNCLYGAKVRDLTARYKQHVTAFLLIKSKAIFTHKASCLGG